jgi:Xaa-Pro aminopeptidase
LQPQKSFAVEIEYKKNGRPFVALKTYGPMAVDWENRIDFDRLRTERLARAKSLLAKSEMGALLCFDMNNVRYITSTHIGSWAQDKISRFTLLPQNDEPILWDFGSAARHHQLNCPWLGDRSRSGIPLLRGAMSPEMGRAENVAKKIKVELEMRGLHKQPLGVDVIEPPILFALQREGITVVDGQQLMSDARVIKTRDEISLLNHSAMMVDAAYDELYRAMKPGFSENQAVGLASKVLYDMGSEYVEAVNAISGERCSPHPHVFSDRVLRPGDPVYYDILHSYMGYRTCYYRCFSIGYASHSMIDAYKRCRDYLDAAISLVKPGRTTAEIAAVWPTAQEFGFPDEEAAFALQFGHGIGLAIWEKPIISRMVSLEHSHEIKPGMVFALETFWPSTDGWSAARIEEEIVVTETGHEVITRFPAEELLVAGAHYFTVSGPLSTTRESEAAPSKRVVAMVESSAKKEGVGATD